MQLHSVYCNCLLDVIWPGAGSLVSNSVAICRPINRHAIQQDIQASFPFMYIQQFGDRSFNVVVLECGTV